MRPLDYPPAWLLALGALAWAIGRWDPWGLSLAGPVTDLAAGLLIGGGAVLVGVAARTMRQARTAVMPGREARALVTTGVFRWSRNPIYLGFALVLLGWILWLDAILALPLLPLFAWVIERRFIGPEEAMLERRFGAAFATWAQGTRRWL